MTPGFDRGEYARLVAVFPPVTIGDHAQAEATEARIEALLAQRGKSAAERAYLDLLSDLLATEIHNLKPDCQIPVSTRRRRSVATSLGGRPPASR